jgi:hypothetical protein
LAKQVIVRPEHPAEQRQRTLGCFDGNAMSAHVDVRTAARARRDAVTS